MSGPEQFTRRKGHVRQPSKNDHWMGDLSILSHGRHGGQETPHRQVYTLRSQLRELQYRCENEASSAIADSIESNGIDVTAALWLVVEANSATGHQLNVEELYFNYCFFYRGKGHGRKMEEICVFFLRICFFSMQTGEILVPTFKTDICWVGRTLSPTNYNILYYIDISSNMFSWKATKLTTPRFNLQILASERAEHLVTSGSIFGSDELNTHVVHLLTGGASPSCLMKDVGEDSRASWRISWCQSLRRKRLRTKNHEHALEWQLKKCDTIHISWCSH